MPRPRRARILRGLETAPSVSDRRGQSPEPSARVAHDGARTSSWASIAVQYWILVLDGGACAACELRACGRLLAALSVCLH